MHNLQIAKKMNVLVAPANTVLGDVFISEGTLGINIMKSEGMFAINIMKYIVRNYRNISFSAICGMFGHGEYVPRLNIYRLLSKPPSSWVDELSFAILCYTVGRRLLREKRFELIHHMFPFNFKVGRNLLAVLNGLGGRPFIVGPIELPQAFEDGSSFLKRVLYKFLKSLKFSKLIRAMNEKTLSVSDALIFDSKKTLNLYRQTYHDLIKNKKLIVIPAGVEVEKFRYTQPLSKNYLELLTVGALIKRKGIEYLLQSMKHILEEVGNVKLRIVGGGPYEPTLKKIAKDLGVENKVIFEGHVLPGSIEKYYQLCDIYVHPSLSETFPFAIKEAMSVGRPIVATKVGFTDEHLKNGVHGYLIPPKDPKALADAVLKLLENEALRYKMGLTARKYIEENLQWDIIAKKWYEVYSDLAEKR